MATRLSRQMRRIMPGAPILPQVISNQQMGPSMLQPQRDHHFPKCKCFEPIHRDLRSKQPSGQIIYLGRNPYKKG